MIGTATVAVASLLLAVIVPVAPVRLPVPGYRAHCRFLSAAWPIPPMVRLRAEGPNPGNP